MKMKKRKRKTLEKYFQHAYKHRKIFKKQKQLIFGNNKQKQKHINKLYIEK